MACSKSGSLPLVPRSHNRGAARRLPGANPHGNVDLRYSALRTVSALVIEHGGDEEQAIGAPLLDAAEDQG
jgi:hypothetical protein